MNILMVPFNEGRHHTSNNVISESYIVRRRAEAEGATFRLEVRVCSV